MKKVFLSLFFILATLTTVNAAKSAGNAVQFPQPDGTIITVRLLGDEHLSWYQAEDGVLLVRGEDGAFYIAQTDFYGSMTSTGILAHDAALRSYEEASAIEKQDRDSFFSANLISLQSKQAAETFLTSIPGYPSKNSYCPHSGTIRVPIILMNYTNLNISQSQEVIEEYFNGTATTPYSAATKWQGYSSVTQYFKDASFGKLNLVFDIYGPYTADNNHDYYGKANGDSRSLTLYKEAVQKADGDIDFSQYDSDGNGKVDMVYILYAGTGANLSGNKYDIWPGCWTSGVNISTKDGKNINVIGGANELLTYAATSPTKADLRAGVGVTCHEMSHGMGLPDLYNTGTPYVGGREDWSNCGPEDWDLMDGGENIYNALWPCQYTAWERDVMGWTDIEELTEPDDITIYPLDDSLGRGKAYRVTNPANTNEYYIIENYGTKDWNQYITNNYGSGLMLYHLNSSTSGFSMTPNNVVGKPNITILPADDYIMALYNSGKTIEYKGSVVTLPKDYSEFRSKYFVPETKGDPYPGSQNVTAVAAYKNYTGEDMVNKYPITDIKKNTDGSVSFKFMGGKSQVLLGDADGNGVVNKDDAYAVINYYIGETDSLPNKEAADVNGDGIINMIDANMIVNIYLEAQKQ